MKNIILIALSVLIVLSCTQRDDGMGSRSNPFDAGGDAWSVNAPPEVTATLDSGWADYNYTTSTGSYRLHISASDRNKPVDTLEFSVSVHTGETTVFSTTTLDSIIVINRLGTGATYQCSVVVKDRKSFTDTYTVSFTTPDLPPPARPEPYIVSGSSFITLRWPVVSEVEEYHVYKSARVTGPYTLTHRMNQKSSGTIMVTDTPSGYSPVYYLVASANNYGESFADDTLLGRLFYSGISAPDLRSVSNGSYNNYIQLSIYYYSYSSSIDSFEIFRSIGDTLNFRLIRSIAYRSSSYTYYNDSVTTGKNCYYRVTAIDKSNRSSRMSDIEDGYIRRLSRPSLYSGSSNYISINIQWSSVSGAQYYRLYRSTTRCSDTMSLFDSTTNRYYYDTVPTSETYYYRLSAVDAGGREGTLSQCYSKRVSLLPAPSSFRVNSGQQVHSIGLSWFAVSNANGYIIFRSTNGGSSYSAIDTLSDTSFVDTIPDGNTHTFYYKVAAYNNRGTGTMTSYKTGTTLHPPTLSVTNSSPLRLRWSPSSYVSMYYIYRSTDTITFTCVDSTISSTWYDTLPDYRAYYYYLVVRADDGVSAPGDTVTGTQSIPQISGLTATDTDSGCIISWNTLPGAKQYTLHRSTTSSSYPLYKECTDTFYFDTISSTQRYYYRVKAQIDNRTSPISSYVSGGSISVPFTPTDISAAGTASGISLTWALGTNSSTAAGYVITRSTSATTPATFIDTTSERVYIDSVPDTLRYFYRIAAYNSKGTSSYSSYYSAQRQLPSAPSGITPSQGTYASKIIINWNSVASVTGYRCYRSTSSNGTYELIATTSSNMVSDSTCTPGTLYYYRISSIAGSISGRMSSFKSGFRLSPPDTVSVVSFTYGIRCVWPEPLIPITMFYIYRSTSPAGTFIKIDSVNGTVTSYIDRSPVEGNNYYRISARNEDETAPGAVSDAAHLQFPSAPLSLSATKGTYANRIVISWSASSGATGYRLYRTTVYGGDSALILLVSLPTTSFTDAVSTDSMYFYRVKAYNNGGESGLSQAFSGGFREPSSVPLAPTNPETESVSDQLYLTWEPPVPSVGFTGFRVYRSPNSNGSDATVIETTTPWYADTPPLSYPTQYWYRVTAVNQQGESAFSEIVAGSR